ncbi:MAG: LPS assembly lipoprotein LptE [Puniceicoccales bacterium]|jgi:hypothetical protein|nr:LPS assembly lipoprotein LptE [Puniceicoccales bacterium]
MGKTGFILFLLCLIFSGCSHYHSGISPQNVVQSIYVEPVKNSSLCPKASGPLTAQLTKKIQRSTPLKLAHKGEAQSHLRVEIVDFSQKNSAYDPKDTSIALSVNLRIVAECTLVDRSGKSLLERQRVEVAVDLLKGRDFHSLRDQAIPQLMERLARKICALLVNIW